MTKTRKTALLITYYWPPAGGAGVHRWLRFSHFFKDANCKLHVYCPKDAAWPTLDEGLLNDVPKDVTVIRNSIFEPHKYLGKKNNPNVGAGLTQTGKQSFKQKLIIWVRGNLFIPDSRKFWIKPSTRFLSKYLKNNPEIDTIISTGPPHSTHLIANNLKAKFPKLKWIADFRDPWTDIDFYADLLPGKWADNKHRKLEKAVLINADEVVTVSQACAEGLEQIGQRKVHVITNGYNFPEFDSSQVVLDSTFTIAHFGSMPYARNPKVLWQALHLIKLEQPTLFKKIKVKLIGPVDYKVFESARELDVEECIEHIPSVTHKQSIEAQRTTPMLLLVANNTGNVKGIVTGKVFEYLGAKRPIVAIGELDSDLEKIILTTNSGSFIDYAQVDRMKEVILQNHEAFCNNTLYIKPTNLEAYSSKNLAHQFIELMG